MSDRYIIAAIDDLFFASKIRATAQQLGVEALLLKTEEDILETARARHPALIIVDLSAQRFDPLRLAQHLKSETALRDIPLLGFFSHVQVELRQRAVQAGYNQVLPRSAFTRNLPALLMS